MTDNEIIKALEAEIHFCELFDDSHANGISLEFLKDTLAYINRQKAEIERLKRSLDNMTDALIRTDDYCRAVEHSETLLKERDNGIREFAEKLKEHFNDLECSLNRYKGTVSLAELVKHTEWILHEVAIQAIDAFVKEMVGEDDGCP